MAWSKKPQRKKHKQYARFSSSKVKTKSSGVSRDAVFAGGRMIPVDAKSLFNYRDRGYVQYEQVKTIKLYGDLHSNWDDMPKEGPTSQERLSALMKQAAEHKLKQVQFDWSGELRRNKLHTWNRIELVPGYFFTWLFFEANHYVILQKGLDEKYRRTIVYTDRDKLYRDFERSTLCWAEVFDIDAEPSLADLPRSAKAPRP